jgi:hypothetical protein
VHERGEAFHYPSVRADSSSALAVAERYLECALTQVASLRLQDAQCNLALVTNVADRAVLGRAGSELVDRIEAFGVELLPTEYHHRPEQGIDQYLSSRYLFDAILADSWDGGARGPLWLTDVDCVWADPGMVFASAPPPEEIGCIYIDYPPDWDPVGHGTDGLTRRAIGELAANLGGSEAVPPWVGGELLCGTPRALEQLVRVCDELDAALAGEGKMLPMEEQILSLAGATGRVRFRDLSQVARRMSTGARTRGATVEDPLSIGLWHLPSEKGSSLRRAASDVRRGRVGRLRRDFSDPVRAARRFNVAGSSRWRTVRDDGWIAAQRVRGIVRSGLRTVRSMLGRS